MCYSRSSLLGPLARIKMYKKELLLLPADQIQSQKHGKGQEYVYRHHLSADVSPMIGQFGGPHEVVGTRDWMDGTN